MAPANDWKNTINWKYPYKGINDPNYIENKLKTFIKNGNGWWWGYTKLNTPLPGIYSSKDDRRGGGDRGPNKVDIPPKEDFTDGRNR